HAVDQRIRLDLREKVESERFRACSVNIDLRVKPWQGTHNLLKAELADNGGSSLIPLAVLRVLNSKACRGSGYIGSSFSIRLEIKHDGCGLARVETVSNGVQDNDESLSVMIKKASGAREFILQFIRLGNL
nr:hypothetical protein [Tanacetum cinerariifolium]